MLDEKDPSNSNEESQPMTSNNNATIVNETSAIDNQEESNPQKFSDDTIYDNMIFPS